MVIDTSITFTPRVTSSTASQFSTSTLYTNWPSLSTSQSTLFSWGLTSAFASLHTSLSLFSLSPYYIFIINRIEVYLFEPIYVFSSWAPPLFHIDVPGPSSNVLTLFTLSTFKFSPHDIWLINLLFVHAHDRILINC